MKRMLSFKSLLFAAVAAVSFSVSNAQSIITTAYTNNPGRTAAVNAPGNGATQFAYITFDVTNSNCYPVTITDISNFHISSATVGGTPFSQNGAVYTLLYTSTNMAPALATTLPTGYTIAGSSAPITTNVNAITPVISGMNFVVPPATTYRCALYMNDTLVVAGTQPVIPTPGIAPLPGAFTVDGVTLTTVGTALNGISRMYLSTNAGVGFTAAGELGFEGEIKFRPSGPSVTALNNNACIGDSITLSAIVLPPPCVPAGAIIQWSGPGGSSHTGSPWKIEANSATAGDYFVTYSVNGETSAPTKITVTVTAPPPAPGITGKRAYCLNEQFEPVTVTGTNILWYINPTGGTGTTLPPYVNTTQPGSYTWYASQTTANGCEGPRTKITITVAPKPSAPSVVSPIGYCELSPADSLKAVGQNLKWFVVPFGGLGSIFAPTPNTSVKDTFTWYVSQTVDGCESPRSKIDVVVTFRPNGMIVVSRDPEICEGDTLSFFYYGSGNATTAYGWSVPPVGAEIVAGANGPGPFVVRFDSAGIRQVTLIPSNLGCVGDKYVQDVEIKAIPSAIIAAPQSICKNDDQSITLFSFEPADIDTFTWSWDGGISTYSSTDQGPYGVYWPTAGKKIISLRITERGCSGFATDSIYVRELPDSKIVGYDGRVLCQSDSIVLQPGTVVPTSKYQWSPVKHFGEFSNLPIANAEISQNEIIKLEVEDEFGCKNADSLKFVTKPCCEMVFPNAFTPNGDGKNETFHPVYVGSSDKSFANEGNKHLRSLRIVNRWGQAVFESANTNTGWDGKVNGKPQDMGMYYYYISYMCGGKLVEQKGEVMLVR